VRSPYPHARIRTIDASAARSAPGVLAVLTGEDGARLAKPLAYVIPPAAYGRAASLPVDRPILAVDRVRHVADGVAFIVAETAQLAHATAELVKVDYERLPEHLEPLARPSGVPIWVGAPDNVAFDWQFGGRQLCLELFGQATHIVRISLSIPRVIPNPIEPRAAIGLYDPHTDKLTLVSDPQGVHFVRGVLTRALGLPEHKLRVISPYVGGAFGSNIYAYPEHALVLLATSMVGRPVRWTSTRTEAFLSDTQKRPAASTPASKTATRRKKGVGAMDQKTRPRKQRTAQTRRRAPACQPIVALMRYGERTVGVIAEASGQRVIIESVDEAGRTFRSAVKWASLTSLDEQLF